MNIKSIAMALLVFSVIVMVSGCTGTDSQTESSMSAAGPIAATWITPQIEGNLVSIPAQEVEDNTIVHFSVDTSTGPIAMMAYEQDDDIIVRSNVCPPCNSIGFSLASDTLVCDSCGTTFETSTGEGIQGACAAYPKEEIKYTQADGNLVMDFDDIVEAHRKTIQQG
ncbi:nitrite reductase/ring-hydroxylating ferredoxin subunit [Methanohalophilus levihalophilus]|uniref:Fe-S-containing protein n=1 Tax=Methanohalophilus levihalophilus TaxID=1431282 RepID=UPI001AE63A20|nr:Fe-S-containing protein [Methanohalophilus levihalophilus]MBP2031270.1 nitrite reductase/ring-hydroxylating ferredoxin subunit [Methanohalophilus levihalophilus]